MKNTFRVLGAMVLLMGASAMAETSSCVAGSLHAFTKDDKIGFVDCNGKWVIEPRFDNYGSEFGEDNLALVYRDDIALFINEEGETIIEGRKGLIYSGFSEGLASFTLDGENAKKYFGADEIDRLFGGAANFEEDIERGIQFIGFIDLIGKVKIQPIYFCGGDFGCDIDFRNGMVIVQKNDKFGAINKEGETVIPFDYDGLEKPSEGYVQAFKDEKDIIIDYYTGKEFVVFTDDQDDQIVNLERDYHEVIVKYSDPDTCTGINIMDKSIFEYPRNVSDYISCSDFHNGLALVAFEDKVSYVNSSGEFPMKDKSGKIMVFEQASDFHEGLGLVSTADGYGYIDTNGKFVIPPRYATAGNFVQGVAWVADLMGNGTQGAPCLIDKSGREIICE